MIFIPTYLKSEISVLRYAYFAYTMYGVSVTPALFAALTWKRATRQGGVASIVGGALATVFFEVLLPCLAPSVMVGTDAWGIPSFYPAAVISIGLLVVVSLMTPPPRRGGTRAGCSRRARAPAVARPAVNPHGRVGSAATRRVSRSSR